jgi:hypothetical protein
MLAVIQQLLDRLQNIVKRAVFIGKRGGVGEMIVMRVCYQDQINLANRVEVLVLLRSLGILQDIKIYGSVMIALPVTVLMHIANWPSHNTSILPSTALADTGTPSANEKMTKRAALFTASQVFTFVLFVFFTLR